MAIRKFTDITNETDAKYTRYKNTQIKKTIEDVFDTGSALNSPNDAAIQFLKEKLEDVIDENNDKIVGKQPVFTDTTQTITGNKFFGTTTKLHFRDSGIYLNSNTDGTLQIVSDDKVNIFGKVKIMNSALTASGAISASGTIFTPTISFNNGDITLDNSSDHILVFDGGHFRFTTDAEARFGSSQILRISSDNTDGDIRSAGNLKLRTTTSTGDILFQSGSTEFFRVDGGVGYMIASKAIRALDSVNLQLGTSADLVLQHDGSHSYISQNGTGNLYIQQNTNNADIVFQCDDGSGGTTAYLTLDGSNGYTVATKQIRFNDNVTAKFGSAGDMSIYHDGSNSYIDETGTGNLKIRSNRLQLEKYTGETMAEFIADGASSLYYDNSKKLETTSTGVDVTGNVVVSGTVDGRDIATDGTKLDGIESNATADQTGAEIKTALFNESDTNNLTDTLLSKLNGVEASADVTDTTNVTAAGALMDSELTDLAGIKSLNTSTLQVKPSEGAFANGDKTKLDGIATGADVTPTWVPSVDPRYLTNTDLTRDVSNTLPIANGGTGATTAGAALTALGAAASSHTHAASDITSGTLDAARIPDDMDSGKVKQICTTHHNFFMNSTANPPTADFFVPFNNLNESSNPTNTQYYNRTVAPYGGRLVKIALHTTAAIGNACKAQFWIANSTGTFASYTEEVTGIDLNTANSSDTATFSSATFSEGDVIGVSIIKSTTATANMQVTLVWEYTL